MRRGFFSALLGFERDRFRSHSWTVGSSCTVRTAVFDAGEIRTDPLSRGVGGVSDSAPHAAVPEHLRSGDECE
jgi:hypothetical protein